MDSHQENPKPALAAERDHQRKMEILKRKRPADRSLLNPEKPQFNLAALFSVISLACVIAAAIATRHPALVIAACFIVWVKLLGDRFSGHEICPVIPVRFIGFARQSGLG